MNTTYRSILNNLGIVLAASVCSVNAFATSLTFELVDCQTDRCLVDQDYGDRVVGTSDAVGSYGAAGGNTPNVTVEYVPTDGRDSLSHWTTGYNELENVLYNEQDGALGFSVIFTADPGFEVTLESLNVGNFGPALNSSIGQSLQIFGENMEQLFTQELELERGVASSGNSLLISAGVSGRVLELFVNTAPLGRLSDNIGLDNIVFSQQQVSPVPLPAAVWLFLTAFGALVGVKRVRS